MLACSTAMSKADEGALAKLHDPYAAPNRIRFQGSSGRPDLSAKRLPSCADHHRRRSLPAQAGARGYAPDRISARDGRAYSCAAITALSSPSQDLSLAKAASNSLRPIARQTPATRSDKAEIVSGNVAASSSAPFSLMR